MKEWEKNIAAAIQPNKFSNDILLVHKDSGFIFDRITVIDGENTPADPNEWVERERLDPVWDRAVREDGTDRLEIVKEAEFKRYYKFDELSPEKQKKIFQDIQKDSDNANALEGLKSRKLSDEELKETAIHGIYLKGGELAQCFYGDAIVKDDPNIQFEPNIEKKENVKYMLQQSILFMISEIRKKEDSFFQADEKDFFRQSLAYNLVAQTFAEFKKSTLLEIECTLGDLSNPKDIVAAVQRGPFLSSYPDKFDKLCKENPAVLAMEDLIKKAAPEKIKQTLDNLLGKKREKECKHLKNEGKALSGR